MASLYEKIILQHYHQPLNRGRHKRPTLIFRGANLLCGDELIFYVTLNKHRRITIVHWEGSGCVLSQAAASIVSEAIKGKSMAAVQRVRGQTLFGPLLQTLSPTRLKCLFLPLEILKRDPNP